MLEARVGLVEVEIHESRRTVALLADNDLGAALERVAVLVGRPFVHLLAVDEHDQICILLDRAGLAKVRELRPLVLSGTLLRGARKLRQGDDGNSELAGESLQ